MSQCGSQEKHSVTEMVFAWVERWPRYIFYSALLHKKHSVTEMVFALIGRWPRYIFYSASLHKKHSVTEMIFALIGERRFSVEITIR